MFTNFYIVVIVAKRIGGRLVVSKGRVLLALNPSQSSLFTKKNIKDTYIEIEARRVE